MREAEDEIKLVLAFFVIAFFAFISVKEIYLDRIETHEFDSATPIAARIVSMTPREEEETTSDGRGRQEPTGTFVVNMEICVCAKDASKRECDDHIDRHGFCSELDGGLSRGMKIGQEVEIRETFGYFPRFPISDNVIDLFSVRGGWKARGINYFPLSDWAKVRYLALFAFASSLLVVVGKAIYRYFGHQD